MTEIDLDRLSEKAEEILCFTDKMNMTPQETAYCLMLAAVGFCESEDVFEDLLAFTTLIRSQQNNNDFQLLN